MHANTQDYLKLHFIVFIWGFTAILGKWVSLPAIELVLYRTALAALGMAFLRKVLQGKSLVLSRSGTLHTLLTGAIVAAHWMLFFAAARVANVSACLVGMATTSLWTSLIEPLANRQKISKLEMALGALVAIGLYFIFQVESRYLVGIWMAIASALLGSVFSVINARLSKQHDAQLITLYEMAGAFLAALPFLPISLYIPALSDGKLHLVPTTADLLSILTLAWVCTVYAYSASVQLLRRISAFTMNLTVNLEPVYGIGLAYLIFGESEKMPPNFYWGGLLIMASVFLYPLLRYLSAKRQVSA
jgi:drug/metabolite transporter (DMT)-like permease